MYDLSNEIALRETCHRASIAPLSSGKRLKRTDGVVALRLDEAKEQGAV